MKLGGGVCVALTLTLLLAMVAVSSATPAGLRVIVTQKALDYAKDIVFPILKEKLMSFTIPNKTFTFNKGLIHVNFTLSNMKIKSLNFGDPSLTTDVNGVVLKDNGVSMAMSADWSYILNSPHIKDSGTVDISMEGVSLAVTVDLKRNKTSGGVYLNTTSCYFNVGKISVVFHGGESWLYNLLSSFIEDFLRGYINDKGCSLIRDEIDTEGNSEAETLKVVTQLGKYLFNYSLVADPDFSHKGIIVILLKGEFLLASNPQDPPFMLSLLPELMSRNYSKMFYVQANEYVAESASYVLWKTGIMAYNLTNDELPSGLQTTTAYCCLIDRNLCTKYPDKRVMFGISASDYPRVEVISQYAVISGKAGASMYVENDGRQELVFTLALEVQASVNVYLSYNSSAKLYYIYGNVSDPKIEVKLAASNIGKFNISNMKDFITTVGPTLGLAYINNYIRNGFPLPELSIDGVSITNASLTFEKGYMEASGDVLYSPEYYGKASIHGRDELLQFL